MIAVEIDARGNTLDKRISGYKIKLTEEMSNSHYELASHTQYIMRITLRQTTAKWKDKIWNSIRAVKLSKFKSELRISLFGIYLDRMRPHWVALKRGRLITQWARERGVKGKTVRFRNGNVVRMIFVKPHPFIDEAISVSRVKFAQIIKRRLAIARRGLRT